VRAQAPNNVRCDVKRTGPRWVEWGRGYVDVEPWRWGGRICGCGGDGSRAGDGECEGEGRKKKLGREPNE
jgi:hypothetical protein